MALPLALLAASITLFAVAYMNLLKAETEGRIMFWWLIGIIMVFVTGCSAIALTYAIVG